MFKILVADDEKFIRKGIVTILSKNISMEVMYIEASNGIEALEQARMKKPNLIITDISMPGLSGLEFIEALKKENVNTAVIILSGYENFEYAKSAIKLGVKEYVMKPIKKPEFIELIQGYVKDIKSNQIKSAEENIRKIENEKTLKRLKYDFLVGLLRCPTSDQAKQYLAQLKSIGMTFAPKLYTCAVIQYRVDRQNQEYMDFAVKNILDEYFTFEVGDEFVENVSYTLGEMVVIFEGSSREALQEPKKKIMRKAVQLIEKYCKVKAYAGLGDVAYDSIHLHTALQHAIMAADFKILDCGDNVNVYKAVKRNVQVITPECIKKFKNIEKTDIFDLLEFFQKMYQEAKKQKDASMLKVEYEATQEFLGKQILRRQQDKKMWEEKYRSFSTCWTIGELKQEIKERWEILTEAREDTISSNTKLMHQVRQYVDEHITEELDLNNIAEKFHRTPGYISTLFKKYVEGGFNSYITKERIEIAKHLLEDGSISIQEVGEMCGYNNAKYFSVVFKKTTGDTPSGYREQFIV